MTADLDSESAIKEVEVFAQQSQKTLFQLNSTSPLV